MILHNHTPCLHYCTTTQLLHAGHFILLHLTLITLSPTKGRPTTTVVTYLLRADICGTLLVSRYCVVERLLHSRYLS
jgi:hypothetical protein